MSRSCEQLVRGSKPICVSSPSDLTVRAVFGYPSVGIKRVSVREEYLAEMAQKSGWKWGAELGLSYGRTFLHLLKHVPNLTLIGVDLWAPQPGNPGPEDYVGWPHEQNERRVREGAKEFGGRAVIYKMRTDEAAALVPDGSLDFIFIDADHSAEAVRRDIELWSPKVRKDGWICGHDINWPSVREVVEQLLPGYITGPDNMWGREK